MPGLVLQAGVRPRDERPSSALPESAVRYGLTASRKVGGAVVRNRARRRLRALAEGLLPQHGKPGCDYVLIARQETAGRDFSALQADLLEALSRTAKPRRGRA